MSGRVGGTREKEREKKIKCKVTVTMLHGYCNKIGYLQSYTTTDACVFYAILCKFLHFFVF